MNEHLVVVGFDEIVSNKYIECIIRAVKAKKINGYSIVDLESVRSNIEKRIEKLQYKPREVYYLNDIKIEKAEGGLIEQEPLFDAVFDMILKKERKIKVYIATEVKAHQKYLEYCVKNGISSLTEKPIFLPIKNNVFSPKEINCIMQNILEGIKKNNVSHSVMTLSRYHKVYNDKFIDVIRQKMIKYSAPITSIHLRHAGGVWNTHKEYISRDDHPYKYGYGMIMHGGYHYIDLVVQLLLLNKLIYPNDVFQLKMSSYVAYPKDQNERISKKISSLFDDNIDSWENSKEAKRYNFGETDVTSTFELVKKSTGKVVTLGTISLEQTTPSVRKWKDIPEGIYNKNGRVSSVDVEAQLSTIYSKTVKCYDVPVKGVKEIERIDATADILTRANAALLEDEEYIEKESYTGVFHSDSNKALMLNWLYGTEERSEFEKHIPVMTFVQVMAESIQRPGKEVCKDLF